MSTNTGPAVDAVVHVADGVAFDSMDYGVRIEERLQAAGLRTARRDLTRPDGEPPPAGLHVLTGGVTSVGHAIPWMAQAIEATRRLVAEARDGAHTVVGICLGSQLVAEAIRPHSVTAAERIEIGLTVVSPPGSHRPQLVVPAFHYESVAPALADVADVDVWWGNAHTTVQAFSSGPRVFGFQFHPELTASDMYRLIDHHAKTIETYGGDVATAHATVDRYGEDLAGDLFERLVLERVPA